MKKFISLTMASVLAMSLVACGSETTTTEEPATTKDPAATEEAASGEVDPASYEGEILVWLDNDEWATAVIEGFNAIYPNITVNYENVGSVDQRAKLQLDGPAGIGPDVMIEPHDHVGVAINDGLLEPLTADYVADLQARILPASLGTATVDGEVYGAPISTENIALFYNKDIYGETAPTTFDEIVEFSKSYNDPANNKYALRWDMDDAYHNYFFLSAFGYNLFGENHDDYTQMNLESEEAVAGITYQNSLKEIFGMSTADATWDETVAKFQNGEAAFTISGPWAIADAKNNGVNFGVAKLPTINGVQPTCFSGNIVASVSAFSENKEMAQLFLQYLTSVEGAGVTYGVTGKMPAFQDVSAVEGVGTDEYLMGIAEQAPYSIPMPTIAEMSLAWTPLAEIFTFSWDGELSPADAAKKAMETYELSLNTTGKSIND